MGDIRLFDETLDFLGEEYQKRVAEDSTNGCTFEQFVAAWQRDHAQ